MLTLLEAKICLDCGKPLKGRVGKKYCDDYCRTNYHNQIKARGSYSNYVRNINNALLKNRRVLASIVPASVETAKVTKEKLIHLGFQFKFHTHIHKTKMDKFYYYSYDYGYLPLDNDWFLIIRNEAP